MIYRYIAVDRDGRRFSGTCRADHLPALETRLARRQLELVQAGLVTPWQQRLDRPLPRDLLIDFCFQLQHLLQAGIPLVDALTDLQHLTEHAEWRERFAEMQEHLEHGQSLSAAMQSVSPAFDPVIIQLVAAGEQSGELPTILGRLTDNLRWQSEMSAQARKALIYPAITAAVIGSVSLFLILVLVPQLKTFVHRQGQVLPLHSQILFGLSDALIAHAIWLFPMFATLALAGIVWARHPDGRARLDRWRLRLPLLGRLWQQLILARVASLLGLLYAAGIPLIDALCTTARLAGNHAFETALNDSERRLREGASLATALGATSLFPGFLLRMVRTGEQTGRLTETLAHAAAYYQRNVRDTVSRLQVLIEPVLTVFMGLLLGWITLAVIGPIYDVISRIRL